MKHPARVALFAMILAAAGLPLYIHLPRFAAAELGLSLTTVSLILIGIRCLDFIQDPALGRLIDAFPARRSLFAALALGGVGLGFLAVFTLSAQIASLWWLIGGLVLLFTAYSLGSVLFYGQTIALAGSSTPAAIYRLSAYREAGMLAGIIVAAAAPMVLGYAGFGLALAAMAVLIAALTHGLWRGNAQPGEPFSFSQLRAAGGTDLIALAFVNALPVAMTSTLFLFFVEDRLMLRGLAGPFLILFFIAAGLSVPLWTRALKSFGARGLLAIAMSLSIVAFMGAAVLPQGAAFGFGVISIASGLALGADMIILPALFAGRLNRAGLKSGLAFGIWSFALKLALAAAALILLPFLDAFGFEAGGQNTKSALGALTFAYAVLPCVAKLIAIVVLLRLPREVFSI